MKDMTTQQHDSLSSLHGVFEDILFNILDKWKPTKQEIENWARFPTSDDWKETPYKLNAIEDIGAVWRIRTAIGYLDPLLLDAAEKSALNLVQDGTNSPGAMIDKLLCHSTQLAVNSAFIHYMPKIVDFCRNNFPDDDQRRYNEEDVSTDSKYFYRNTIFERFSHVVKKDNIPLIDPQAKHTEGNDLTESNNGSRFKMR